MSARPADPSCPVQKPTTAPAQQGKFACAPRQVEQAYRNAEDQRALYEAAKPGQSQLSGEADDRTPLAKHLGTYRLKGAITKGPAVANDQNALGQRLDVVHVVRCENDRDVFFLIEGLMKARKANLELASSPIVGSSRNRIDGVCRMAAAMSQRMR
jgi:hypothetical protein